MYGVTYASGTPLTKPERLKENFEAANICLSHDEIAAIDEKLNTMVLLVFGGH